ncbi:MAG: hypothetical protein QXU86_06890 [Metallosphaera sp.]
MVSLIVLSNDSDTSRYSLLLSFRHELSVHSLILLDCSLRLCSQRSKALIRSWGKLAEPVLIEFTSLSFRSIALRISFFLLKNALTLRDGGD